MDINKSLEYCKKKHEGQFRKNGTPYYTHPLAVSIMLKNDGYDERFQIAGLFHDLLEDTDATEDEILKLSNKEVLTAVILLTKKKGQPNEEYVKGVLGNTIAKAVKNADRINNLEDALKLTDREFIKRYLKDTEKYYRGRFSTELDEMYEKLKNRYGESIS